MSKVKVVVFLYGTEHLGVGPGERPTGRVAAAEVEEHIADHVLVVSRPFRAAARAQTSPKDDPRSW